MSWTTLGAIAPADLSDARDNAHWAAQVIAAVGETRVAHLADTSHTAMRWDDAQQSLVGEPIEGDGAGRRVGLALPTLSLRVLDAGGRVLSDEELAGLTLAEAYGVAGDAIGSPLTHPGYDMPAHRLADGARFESDSDALAELARWYSNASLTLETLEAPILCWPHHFDIASLLVEDRDSSDEATRTIGVGFSPGDEAIDEPYWYVNHWPGREDPKLGDLTAGRWQIEGFTAAVLEASELVRAPDQEALLRGYLDSAIAATRALLAWNPRAGNGRRARASHR